jgi:hypothetical protein
VVRVGGEGLLVLALGVFLAVEPLEGEPEVVVGGGALGIAAPRLVRAGSLAGSRSVDVFSAATAASYFDCFSRHTPRL